ncbi:kinase-like domain-containing protein [Apiospora arundinis]
MDDLRARIGRPYRRPLDDNRYHQQRQELGRARAETCRQYFSRFGQFEQQELLSVGGFGVVIKYAQADAQGRFLRHFVAKIPKETEGPPGTTNITMFQSEYIWNLRFMGLKHVPQLAWFNQFPIGIPTGPGPFPPGNENFWLANSQYYLFMEYLPYGDLRELLYKLNQRESAWPYQYAGIPARLMWRIFLCLTRACIGLAWPRLTLEEASLMAFEPGNIIPKPETLEEIGPYAPTRIVHFDIDPSNVLIGHFQDSEPEHAVQPIFKLGDFGISQEISTKYSRNALIRLQGSGKIGFRSPEQELGASLTPRGLFDPDINTYGVHTNIWGIGITMFSLITKTRPPPIPKFASYPCTLQGQTADSYGWFLAQDGENVPYGVEALYQTFPIELRQLVARCMCIEPQHRPGLGYLLPAIQHYIAQGDALEAQGRSPPGESNADLERFCRDLILGNASETSTEEEEEARDGLGPLPGVAVEAAADAYRRSRSLSRSWITTNTVTSTTSIIDQNPQSSAQGVFVVAGGDGGGNAMNMDQGQAQAANGGSQASTIAYAQADAQQQQQRQQGAWGSSVQDHPSQMDYWN